MNIGRVCLGCTPSICGKNYHTSVPMPQYNDLSDRAVYVAFGERNSK